jgi:hypothetical protein
VPEVLVSADPVALLVVDLKAQYTARSVAAQVGSKVRDPRASTFTRLQLAGGSADVVSSQPMLIVECWAPTDTAAWDLASLTEGLVDSLPDRLGICSGVTNVGGPADSPDPDSGTPRYVFTKVLHLRKHAV